MTFDPNERPLDQPYREDSEREQAWGIRRTETYRSMAEAEKLEKEVRRGWKQLRRGRRTQ